VRINRAAAVGGGGSGDRGSGAAFDFWDGSLGREGAPFPWVGRAGSASPTSSSFFPPRNYEKE
jgi:hypothetical protein